ncbi:MAG: carboxymuconolactone decarboxylase family protein [Calditrichaceae bacterium]|nr:carboxymuconolactone decarboxylase family protein [Calditrichaceae bacterium]
MAFILLNESIPGIRSLLVAYPETGRFLTGLSQQLLRGDSSLSPAEREIIAARVSLANECKFCTFSHAEAALELLPETDKSMIDEIFHRNNDSVLSGKMQALLKLALAVQKGGQFVGQTHIDDARTSGADDKAIHDTVLIAAAFSMFNRYVDGLKTSTPDDPDVYKKIGQKLALDGYIG